MNHLTIDPFLLIRSPAYSFEDFKSDFLAKVLKTEFFRTAIFLASRPLYVELTKIGFAIDKLPPAMQLTLWKYLNRMCYRALPYGFFASYSEARWGESEPLSFKRDGTLHVNPDFKVTLDLVRSLEAPLLHDLLYFPNHSLYRSNKELRFMSETGSTEPRKLAIVQVKGSPELEKLLGFCEKGKKRMELLGFLVKEHGPDAPVAAYLDSLINAQVIVSELAPNVTGKAFHERFLDILKHHQIGTYKILNTLKMAVDWMDPQLEPLNLHVAELMSAGGDKTTYSLYEREVRGSLEGDVATSLQVLVKNMDRLTAGFKSDAMQGFKNDFLRKYDQQEVPLMIVLDPGTGIGYQNLAAAFDMLNDNYVADLLAKQDVQHRANWGALEKLIFRKWSGMDTRSNNTIMITEDDLLKLPDSEDQLPPGMFILFRVEQGRIWADSIGGVSGIELSARFGTSGTSIEQALKKIAAQEMAANPDFVFAEIVWSPNDRVSNINQRGHYFPYEIPILTQQMFPPEYILKLDDLMVSVRDNKIFLRSKRLNRYILPRLSSAFNYKISNVPVFRFLCDLQYQGLKSSLSFTLSGLFPGLDYYPRLQVENAVISPATWILNADEVEWLRGGGDISKLKVNITPHISLQEGDNFLVFNTQNVIEMEQFRKCLKNKTSITLTEYPFTQSRELHDELGKAYAFQAVACVVNKSKAYELPSSHLYLNKIPTNKVKRFFLPGDEWLYIKLYAHYTITDEILIALVLPIAARYRKANPEFKWFYIRYLDPGNHLRLRFYNGGASSHGLLTDLMAKLQSWTMTGRISEVLLDSYQRELEKYSFSLIAEVETLFYRDSEYILNVFQRYGRDTTFKISFGVHSALYMIRVFIPDKNVRLRFLTEAGSSMSMEFSNDKEVLRKLDVRYRVFQKDIVERGEDLKRRQNRKTYRNYSKALARVAELSLNWDDASRQNLFVNLVHMHLNRVFEHTPREYEFLVYHFMKKHQAYLNYTTNDGF